MYERLDDFNKKVEDLLEDWAEISRTAGIFEYPVIEFPEIGELRMEMRRLKNLWDYVNVIESNLSEWKKTTWKKLDIESMDVECKKYTRELRRWFFFPFVVFRKCLIIHHNIFYSS